MEITEMDKHAHKMIVAYVLVNMRRNAATKLIGTG